MAAVPPVRVPQVVPGVRTVAGAVAGLVASVPVAPGVGDDVGPVTTAHVPFLEGRVVSPVLAAPDGEVPDGHEAGLRVGPAGVPVAHVNGEAARALGPPRRGRPLTGRLLVPTDVAPV